MHENTAKKQRLEALDVFRGLTIIAMIIVNSPGTYGQLSHAYWDGLTLADYIFPFFIFISGVTISFQVRQLPLPREAKASLYPKIFKRTLIIFSLGLIVNLFYTEFSAIRIAGVLQRIAIVYCICSILVMYFQSAKLIVIGAFILITYWFVLLFVPAPGLEAGVLERDNNIANWLDYQFLPGMLWRGTWDPEGILSTYPAIVTGLIGVLAGKAIMRAEELSKRINLLFSGGFICLLIGYIWGFYFLFNKALWSSTFVLVTGGIGCLFLALFLWLVDDQNIRKFNMVPRAFGMNALFAYTLHVILEKLMDVPIVGKSSHDWFMMVCVNMGLSKDFTTVLWIAAFLGVCFLPLYVLYRKQIFFKV